MAKLILFSAFLLISLSFVKLHALDFTYYGHKDTIWEIDSDENYLYSVGADGMLKVWDKDLKVIQSISTHSSWARCVDVNEKFVAVGGYKPDNVIRVYDKLSGRLVHTLKSHKASVFTLKFHGDYLISAGSDNSIIIWKDFNVFKVLKFHDGWIRSIIIFNNYIVSGDETGRVNVIELKNFGLVKSFELKSQILVLNVMKDILLIGTSKGDLYSLNKNFELSRVFTFSKSIYSIETSSNYIFVSQLGKIFVIERKLEKKKVSFKIIRKFDVSTSEITSVKLFKEKLFCGDRHGEIFVYTIDGNYVSKSFRHYFSSLKLDGDEDFLYVGRESGIVEAFEKKTGRKAWEVKVDGAVRSLSVFKTPKDSKDTKGTKENDIILSTSTGKLYILNRGKVLRYLEMKDLSTCIIVKGDKAFIGSYENIYTYDFGKLERFANLPGMWITALYLFNNNLFVGTNTGNIYEFSIHSNISSSRKSSKNGTLRGKLDSAIVKILHEKSNNSIISIAHSGKVLILTNNTKKVSNLTVAPVYDAAIVNSDLMIGGSTLKFGNTVLSFEMPIVSIHALNEDLKSNNTFYVGLANGRVLEFLDGKQIRQFASDLGKISILYVDDLIVSGHDDGKVAIWQLDKKLGKYTIEKVLTDHFDSVRDIIRYKDKIITSSNDRSIKVWDLKTGAVLRTIAGHSGYVWAIYLFDDKLVSGSWDGRIIIWDLRDFKKLKEYFINLSVTDLWAISNSTDKGSYNVYVSTLEGYIVKITPSIIQKAKLCDGTLWTIDGKIEKDRKEEVYTAGWDGNIYVLDEQLRLKRTFKGHNATIFKVVLYNGYLISVGSDNILKVWDKGFKQKSEYRDFKQSVLSIALSKTTGMLFTTDGLNIISVPLSSIIKNK